MAPAPAVPSDYGISTALAVTFSGPGAEIVVMAWD